MNRMVDIQRVPATGDPGVAVQSVAIPARMAESACDVLVVGGGTGGTAAALAASRHGLRVTLLEATDWLGGQLTSQGVSALDEHPYIEAFGGTRSYTALREGIRSVYRRRYPGAGATPPGATPPFNPGGCWVTSLAFEPRVAVDVLDGMLAPHVASGRLELHLRRAAVAVEMAGRRAVSVVSMGLDDGAFLRHRFAFLIDASELGDLLPLAGLPYAIGAETIADTGEPHAQPDVPRPRAVQSFTYPSAMRLAAAAGAHRTSEPAGDPPPAYAANRDGQPYALAIHVRAGEIYGETTGTLRYDVFDRLPGTKGGLWEYRRLIDGAQLGIGRDQDVSIFNWPGNDYRARTIVDRPPEEVAASLQEAKWVSLGFLHWIRTEAPRLDGGLGHPEIVAAPDVYATPDALAKHPYIREGRRILGHHRVVEQDVSVDAQHGARAAAFADSAGVGWYPIDIHAADPADIGISTRTRPFQIPLGALVPIAADNVLAGGKNLATTHITNGCYRLHPVEWNTGESAGMLAAFCRSRGVLPADVLQDDALRTAFQASLAADGVPLVWLVDIGTDHPAFAAVQAAAATGALALDPDDLHACRLPASDRRRFGIEDSCAIAGGPTVEPGG